MRRDDEDQTTGGSVRDVVSSGGAVELALGLQRHEPRRESRVLGRNRSGVTETPSGVPGGRFLLSMARRARGTGSVYKEASGGYRAELRVADKRFRIRAATVEEATALLDAMVVRYGLGQRVIPETLAEFIEVWLVDQAERLGPRTYADYAQKLRTHVIPSLGRQRLEHLTPPHVQAMLRAMNTSEQTKAHVRAVLRSALNQALRWGLVNRNVAALALPPKVQRAEQSALTPPEAARLLDHHAGTDYEALLAVALLGLRQSELLGLWWSDFDLDGATLRIQRTLQRVGGEYRYLEVKTRRSNRTLPLPPFVVDVLRAHRARQLREYIANQARPGKDLVFATAYGQPLNASALTRRFHRLAKEAGVPEVRFHDLRHTAASLFIARGVDLRTVMQLLGHSTVATTAEIYAHSMDATMRDAAQRLEEWRAQ